MKSKHTQHLLAAALAGALLVPASAAVAGETNDWSFDVTPYLWLAFVEAETSLPSLPSTRSASATEFDTHISAAAMIAAEARYKSVGLLADFVWLRLDTESSDPGPAYSDGNLKSDIIYSTAALTYTLPLHGKFHVEALAGARVWHVSETIDTQSGVLPGFSESGDATWVSPVIGAKLRYDFSKRWFVGVDGLVGGIGVGDSSDFGWEVMGGVGYRYTKWGSVMAGYRYLHEDFDRNDFELKMDAHGFVLGFGFQF